MSTRRFFLKSGALAMAGAGAVPHWLARAAAGQQKPKKVLVALFQRGAADGLNMVVPAGDPNYYALRPNIAIPKSELVALDGFFGLHPALQPLKPLFDARRLAIVHAAGSPDPTRSHFDAQDYMESGTPGFKATRDGWLNRALPLGPVDSPIRAVGVGAQLPRALRGANPAVAVTNLGDFQVRSEPAAATFEGMYAASLDRLLGGSGRETFEAVKVVQSIERRPYAAENGARYPNGKFAQSLQQIARLIKSDVGLEVAFADMGGWDTHVNEVGARPVVGQLANLLGDFARSIGAFVQDLGARMDDVAIVTMSEFGRTARENGNRGTDHGHANLMLVAGAGVRGGKVYGDWPGLEREQLYEGRDLAVTTDFRDVLSEVVAKHLGVHDVAKVFPRHQAKYRGLLNA